MKVHALSLFALGLAFACSTTNGGGGGPLCEAAPLCTDCDFAPLEFWQRPIDDYVEAYEKAVAEGYKPAIDTPLNTSIEDLQAFDCRLYFAYGDANVNAAQVVPIEIRSWTSPDDGAPVAEDPGAGRQSDLSTREEQIGTFRVLGETLAWAGPDSADDEWLGNVFMRKAGGRWIRHRALPGGVHVHDVSAYEGDYYAVGSGAIDRGKWISLSDEERAEILAIASAYDRKENPNPPGHPHPTWREMTQAVWNQGHVQSLLWRSTDGGETWDVAVAIANEVAGDRRFTQLLPLEDGLYVFGYRTNEDYSIAEYLSYRWDGKALRESAVLPKDQGVGQAEVLDAQTAFLRIGPGYGSDEEHASAMRLRSGGEAEVIDELVGSIVFDAVRAEGGGLLLLSATLPLTDASMFRILYTEDLETFRELFATTIASAPAWPVDAAGAYQVPTSLSWWQGALYVGFANGELWRSWARP